MIAVIMAVSRNGVIGAGGKLPWQGQLPADMRHFKDLTKGGVVIMGRKTYESLSLKFKPLPDRVSIVLSRDPTYWDPSMDRDVGRSLCRVERSLSAALDLATAEGVFPGYRGPVNVFIIGGAEVFQKAFTSPDVTHVYLTRIEADFEGDVSLNLDLSGWRLVSSDAHAQDSENHFNHRFEVYERGMVVDPHNARNEEYKEQLLEIERSGLCPFCPGGLTLTDPEETKLFLPEYEGEYWLVKHNRHYLKGARVHLVLIPKRHVVWSKQLHNDELVVLYCIAGLLDAKFDANGRLFYMREGDTAFTGATVCHLHAQYVIPKAGETVEVRFGPHQRRAK